MRVRRLVGCFDVGLKDGGGGRGERMMLDGWRVSLVHGGRGR